MEAHIDLFKKILTKIDDKELNEIYRDIYNLLNLKTLEKFVNKIS